MSLSFELERSDRGETGFMYAWLGLFLTNSIVVLLIVGLKAGVIINTIYAAFYFVFSSRYFLKSSCFYKSSRLVTLPNNFIFYWFPFYFSTVRVDGRPLTSLLRFYRFVICTTLLGNLWGRSIDDNGLILGL